MCGTAASSLSVAASHYFITGCNLFDHCDRANEILAAEQLSAINQNKLIEWFLDSYLLINQSINQTIL